MARRDWLIVPVFIPNKGCPYRCVFCNQTEISGAREQADEEAVERAFQAYFQNRSRDDLPRHRELAFYGGSFTGLPLERQSDLLALARPWIAGGWIGSIRVSTHPLFIDAERLALLKKFHVGTVELGLQSTDPGVLGLSGRECDMETVRSAVRLIRSQGFQLGLQLMPGLPGDTMEIFRQTVDDTLSLHPDFVRLYPTLVIRQTHLHRMYEEKQFIPWSLEDTLQALPSAVEKFYDAGIPVIRLGLHPDPSMLENYVAGPYHPALRYLVDARISLDQMIRKLRDFNPLPRNVIFKVPADRLSVFMGHKRENIRKLMEMFSLSNLRIQPGAEQGGLELAVSDA